MLLFILVGIGGSLILVAGPLGPTRHVEARVQSITRSPEYSRFPGGPDAYCDVAVEYRVEGRQYERTVRGTDEAVCDAERGELITLEYTAGHPGRAHEGSSGHSAIGMLLAGMSLLVLATWVPAADHRRGSAPASETVPVSSRPAVTLGALTPPSRSLTE